MEFTKKTALGGYKTLPDEERLNSTHVIMTTEEYDELQDQIKALRRKNQEQESNHLDASIKLKNEANRVIQEVQRECNEEIGVYQDKYEAEKAEKEYQIGLNKNLLRICRERANSDRKLYPQAKRSGYIVMSSQEKEIRYRDRSSKNKTAVVWETVLQCPYSIDFTAEQAQKQIGEELLSREGGWKLGRIGINQRWMVSYNELINDKETHNNNTAFNQRFRANYKTGFWEYIVLHTKPIDVVPKDMRPAD